MHEPIQRDRPPTYDELAAELTALLGDERDPIANTANTAALLFHSLPDLNWAGFYFLRGEELVLGPLPRPPPRASASPSARVCAGTAAATRRTQVVPDVHAFPGHIACDARSRSELVVPLVREGSVLGVLDLDSPSLGRFTEEDRAGLERLAAILVAALGPEPAMPSPAR
jgi:L-methionine (R)-S-oxide reductase